MKQKDEPYTEYDLRALEEVVDSFYGDGIKDHTYQNIGKYTIFPKSHQKRMFPRELPGHF